MKKLSLFLVLTLIITIFSCSGDDNNNSTPVEIPEIVGTWKIISIVEDGASLDLSDCRLQSNYIFKLDNTYTNQDFVDAGPGTPPCSDDGFSGTYSISGNNITFKENNSEAPGEEITYEFKIENNTFALIDNSDGSSYTENYSKQQ